MINLGYYRENEIPQKTRIAIELIGSQTAGAIARIRAQESLLRSEQQILEISDREQARIGQDLHDGLCQKLVSLAFDNNSLEQKLAERSAPEAESVREMGDLLDDAITETT